MIPENKTVPFLSLDLPEFQVMPKLLATGFMIGLFEWACIRAINPDLDGPKEQTVGPDIRLAHIVATPPRLMVTVKVNLDKIEGRKLSFSVVGHDEVHTISEGNHERFVIAADLLTEK